MCIIIINGNEIKELVSYDIHKNIYENVRVIVGNEEIENFFLVDNIFQNGDVTSTKIPKQVSVYHKNFFQKPLSPFFIPEPPKEYILPPINTDVIYKTSQTSIKKKYSQHRYCKMYGCNNFATYGPKNNLRTRCAEHRLPEDETYNPTKTCTTCGLRMKYNKWYMHNKLCGMEEEQKCNKCGTITKNIFKHKYTCRSRV
jgi:hypothetical protein